VSASTAVRSERATGCSPVLTLRLLAMADEAGHETVIDEAEQLVLPLEWAWSVPTKPEPEAPKLADRPDPRHWGGRVTLAAFEIMLGNRSANQLSRLVDAKTLHVLAMYTTRIGLERKKLRNVHAGRPRLSSVRCYQPHADAAEVSVVVHDGVRYRAVALRLTGRGGQWVATAFEMG
jgi:hypothetical protein